MNGRARDLHTPAILARPAHKGICCQFAQHPRPASFEEGYGIRPLALTQSRNVSRITLAVGRNLMWRYRDWPAT